MTHDEQMLAVESFVRNHPLAVLATLDEAGRPALASVYLCATPELRCYFITKMTTRKYKNAMERRHTTLFISDEESLTTVEMGGEVAVVIETAETVRAMGLFHDLVGARGKEYWVPPVSQITGSHFVVCRFDPQVIRFTHFDKSGEASVQSFEMSRTA